MKQASSIVLAGAGLIAVLGLSVFLAIMALLSTDGQSGGSGTEPQEGSFFLTDFQYDESISVSWTGISTDIPEIEDNLSAVEVVVSPRFLLILEPGEEYEEFNAPQDIIIPLSGRLHKSYDIFFEDNPYKGRALLTLEIYPRFEDYNGEPVTLLFNSLGECLSVVRKQKAQTKIKEYYMSFCHRHVRRHFTLKRVDFYSKMNYNV